MKKTILILALFLLSIAVVFGQESHDSEIEEGMKLVESKISCDKLSNEQLEAIGEYYMEQMHSGEAHEIMDNMMGGEGSESLKQVHINIAKRLYCDENIYIGYGMMSSSGMMSSRSMMNMMGYNYSTYGYWSIFWILFFIAVICFIVWIIYRFGIKNTVSETPLTILKKRFAQGEITKRQYEEMKRKL